MAGFQRTQNYPLHQGVPSGASFEHLMAPAPLPMSSVNLNVVAKAKLTLAQGLARLPGSKRGWAIGLVAFVLLLVGLFSYWSMPRKTTYYIAYVGRYETPHFDELQLRILKKNLLQLNSQLRNTQLDIKPFTIKKSDTIFSSADSYDAIASDKTIVVVLDNTWGVNLASAAKIIKDKRIPVISMNANRQDVDYQKLVAFIGYDDYIPKKIVAFSQQILHDNKPVFVAEDEKSFPSTASFKRELPGIEPLLVPDSNDDDEREHKLFASLNEQFQETSNRKNPSCRPAGAGRAQRSFVRSPGPSPRTPLFGMTRG